MRYLSMLIFYQAGMRDALALPLGFFFLPSGHARHSRVTAWLLFPPERACKMLSRYRLASFFSRAGMQDALALPLGFFFLPSGYARRSRVTAWLLFSPERVCETLSRYRLTTFSSRAGMRDALALPLDYFFLPSGHARRSRVTARLLFPPERACETLSRYRSTTFSSRAGMRDALALPLDYFFLPSGHARHSRVTALYGLFTK